MLQCMHFRPPACKSLSLIKQGRLLQPCQHYCRAATHQQLAILYKLNRHNQPIILKTNIEKCSQIARQLYIHSNSKRKSQSSALLNPDGLPFLYTTASLSKRNSYLYNNESNVQLMNLLRNNGLLFKNYSTRLDVRICLRSASSNFNTFPAVNSDYHVRRKCNGEAVISLSTASFSSSSRVAANNDTVSKNTSSSTSNTDYGSKLTLPQRFVEGCPAVAKPYLHLLRIDRPIGTWLLFWPCGWGLALAAGPGHWPDPWLLAVFATGALVMRGAGCTINDLWDRDIDKKVKRTQDRPLASGVVTPMDAVVFLGSQLGLGLLVLLQLNAQSVMLGVASLGLVCTYPLVKRVSHWPQLVLGLTFNWGVLLGWCSVHGSVPALPVLPLYAAGVCWTLIYDTIYAHQDKADDLEIGIKSTALRFGEDTSRWLTGFAVAMVSGLLVAGHSAGLAWPYYGAVTATAASLAYQICTLDIHNRADCGRQFRHSRHVGLLVFLGLVAGSVVASSDDSNTHNDHNTSLQIHSLVSSKDSRTSSGEKPDISRNVHFLTQKLKDQ